MISSPFQQKGPRTIPTFPTKEAKRETLSFPAKKGWHEANPFQSQIYAVFAAQFNYRI